MRTFGEFGIKLPSGASGSDLFFGNISDAKDKKMKYFYPGVKCINGHNAARYTSNGRCVVCARLDCLRYYTKHIEKEKKRNRDYIKKFAKENTERSIRWYKNNKHKVNEYIKRRLRDDAQFRISHSFGCSINSALKGKKKNRKWESLAGYTITDLIKHLKKNFKNGMTMDNYGTVWHIDHIIPKSRFKYESEDSFAFRACWSLENLKPMFKEDNLKKGNKIEKPFHMILPGV